MNILSFKRIFHISGFCLLAFSLSGCTAIIATVSSMGKDEKKQEQPTENDKVIWAKPKTQQEPVTDEYGQKQTHTTSPDQLAMQIAAHEKTIRVMKTDLMKLNNTLDQMLADYDSMRSILEQYGETQQPANTMMPPAMESNTPQAGAMPQNLSSSLKPKMSTAPKETAPSTLKSSSPAMSGKTTLKSIRVGEHAGKSRIVFDTNKALKYSYNLDNTENLLIVELPETTWSGSEKWTSDKSKLIASYSIQPSAHNKGHLLILQLRRPTKIMQDMALPPGKYAGQNKGHRAFIDIAAQ